MVTPSQLTSLYEKRAEAQAAQLMVCLEEQSDDEEEEETQLSRSSSRSYRNGSKPRKTVDRQGKAGKAFQESRGSNTIRWGPTSHPPRYPPRLNHLSRNPLQHPTRPLKRGHNPLTQKRIISDSTSIPLQSSNLEPQKISTTVCWIPKSKSPSRNYVEKAQESATSLRKL